MVCSSAASPFVVGRRSLWKGHSCTTAYLTGIHCCFLGLLSSYCAGISNPGPAYSRVFAALVVASTLWLFVWVQPVLCLHFHSRPSLFLDLAVMIVGMHTVGLLVGHERGRGQSKGIDPILTVEKVTMRMGMPSRLLWIEQEVGEQAAGDVSRRPVK